MLFTTDKQTLEDLNVFGKHGSDSLFTIFQRCSTRGGATILEEMFLYPLSDAAAINKRVGIFKYFSSPGLDFPFPSASFDAVEAYLDNTDERTRLTDQPQSIGKKIGNLIATDTETKMLHQGIQSLIALVKTARTSLSRLDMPAAYGDEYEGLMSLLSSSCFVVVLETKDKPGLPEMVVLDALLRFRHRDLVRRFLQYLYLLDVYIAVGKVARERGFVFPLALPREQQLVVLEGVYHPKVKGAIANSIQSTPDNNVIFLTGANMAGKSTFMKSVSIAMYLAHMGFPVAASRMEFAVFDGIYTTINLPDNLGMGASHFYAEVLRVKKMANELAASKRLFIVFDELFRGTNVKDAYEATVAVATGFANKRNSMFIISTHIIEAGDVLRARCANIGFQFLPTRMEGNQPVYTYRLEQGITNDRHGMIIINNEGILDILRRGKKKFAKTGI